MEMGSAKHINGSTMVTRNAGKKRNSHSPKKKSQMNRPKFYPCTNCGRKFTIRALEIHKKSCSENADCPCSACKSSGNGECHNAIARASKPCKSHSLQAESPSLQTESESSSIKIDNTCFDINKLEVQTEVNGSVSENGPNSVVTQTVENGLVVQNDVNTSKAHKEQHPIGTIVIEAQNGATILAQNGNTQNGTSIMPSINEATVLQSQNGISHDGIPVLQTHNRTNILQPQNGTSILQHQNGATVLQVPNGEQPQLESTIDNNALMQLAFVVAQSQPFPTNNNGFQDQGIVSNAATSPNYFIIDKNSEKCVGSDGSSDINGLLLLHDAGLLSLTGIGLDSVNCISNVESHNFSNTGRKTNTITLSNLTDAKVQIISGPTSNYMFSDRKLLCTICSLQLPWEVFGNHIVQHSMSVESSVMKCPKCFKQFTRSAMLLIHFYKHITDCPFFCKDCMTQFRLCDDLKNHTVTAHSYVETQPFHCYICMRRFSHPQTIINHMRLHSKETPFKCNECSRSFSQIGNLQRHLSVHRGDRPHKCPDCDKSFADPATLRNHVRIHTGETPFVCKVCHRGFTQVGNLKRHMARHLQARPKNAPNNLQAVQPSSMVNTDERGSEEEMSDAGTVPNGETVPMAVDDEKSDNPSNSTKENETAIAMSQLKEQRKKHHWQLFPCPVCGKVYTWQHDLSIHFRIHTGEKPYKCDICDKRFAQSGAVRIHKSRHHADEDVYVAS